MICHTKSPAARRLNSRFIGMSLVYAFITLPTVWLFKHHPPSGVVAYLLAILPALPLIAGLVVVGEYLAEEKDEFQRTVYVQAMLWSIGATLSFTSVWGFLENFNRAPHMDLYMVYPLVWAFVGVTVPLLKARYR
jgi:hypothetical protein